MKQLVTMQDISCFGKCSMTVVLPVISAMGVGCSVIPTAVLSTHTAYPGPAVTDLSGGVGDILNHWAGLGLRFDGILTGYLANPDQAAQALELIDRFSGPDSVVVCDPVMGDHGRRYSGIGPEMVEAHRRLCGRAGLILPNATEASLLTGLPYAEHPDEGWCREAARELRKLGCGSAMITGMEPREGQVGFFFSDGSEDIAWAAQRLPKACHGTGDIFAAVVAAGLLRGLKPAQAGALAAEFVRRAIAATEGDTRRGVAFEGELGWLAQAAAAQGR